MSSAFIPSRPLQHRVLALTLRSILLAGMTGLPLACDNDCKNAMGI